MQKVKVVPYEGQWRQAFQAEAKRLTDALGETMVAIHHIGSTAIEGIYAKPIIDMLGEVIDLEQMDVQNSTMVSLGYQGMGEFGIPGRRYFRKSTPDGERTHHLHIFAVGSPQVARHLVFRDYMNAHPEDAQAYSALKRLLAEAYPTDIEAYMDGKDQFLQEMDRKAAQWWHALGEPKTAS